ncbi:MAG: flagellar protein FliS [Lachnospiraceae bacterium]|nr:flagellar protein FliS [Lachnospiraceae bacterium]
MLKEKKQEYTLRISQANKSELVVIIYEILLDYLKECRENIQKNDIDAFHESIRKATGCIRELSSSINYRSNVSGNLLSLNIFCIKELAKADIHYSEEEIMNVELIMRKLYEATKKAGEKDDSPAVMNNSQFVYAGLTYGKESLIVNLNETSNRGFTV